MTPLVLRYYRFMNRQQKQNSIKVLGHSLRKGRTEGKNLLEDILIQITTDTVQVCFIIVGFFFFLLLHFRFSFQLKIFSWNFHFHLSQPILRLFQSSVITTGYRSWKFYLVLNALYMENEHFLNTLYVKYFWLVTFRLLMLWSVDSVSVLVLWIILSFNRHSTC